MYDITWRRNNLIFLVRKPLCLTTGNNNQEIRMKYISIALISHSKHIMYDDYMLDCICTCTYWSINYYYYVPSHARNGRGLRCSFIKNYMYMQQQLCIFFTKMLFIDNVWFAAIFVFKYINNISDCKQYKYKYKKSLAMLIVYG